jgi:hypothetical protein
VNRIIATNFTVQVNKEYCYQLHSTSEQKYDLQDGRRDPSIRLIQLCASFISRFLLPWFILCFTMSFIPPSSIFSILLFIFLIANCVFIRSNECYFSNQHGGRFVLNLIPKKRVSALDYVQKANVCLCCSLRALQSLIYSNPPIKCTHNLSFTHNCIKTMKLLHVSNILGSSAGITTKRFV